jgi:hypothetical protein
MAALPVPGESAAPARRLITCSAPSGTRIRRPAGDRDHRYRKVVHDSVAIERLFVELFLDAHRTPPKPIILDLDARHDGLHGHQEGRFCYLPMYVFCGLHLLAGPSSPLLDREFPCPGAPFEPVGCNRGERGQFDDEQDQESGTQASAALATAGGCCPECRERHIETSY